MSYLVSILITGCLLGFSSFFHQSFYLPKIIALFIGGLLGVTTLLQQERVLIPSNRAILFFAAYIITASVSIALSPSPWHSFLCLLLLFSGFLSYWFMLNLSEGERERTLKVVCGLALLQIGVLTLQTFNVIALLPGPLIIEQGRLTGTIGNPEFLSTVLAVAFLISLHLNKTGKLPLNRTMFLAGLCALLAGIVAAGSKGTLIFLALYGLWRWKPGFKSFGLTSLTLGIFASLYSPASIAGRVFLWLVGAQMFIAHPLAGVGLGQFENNYLQTVYGIFSSWPGMAGYFGSYTSAVLDAHNIFLHNAAELGLAGLTLTLTVWIFLFNRARIYGGYLGAALLLLLYKSLYTVMLNSPTGLLLTAILVGAMTEKRELQNIKVNPVWTPVAIPVLAAAFFLGFQLCRADYYYQKGLKSLISGDRDNAEVELTQSMTIDPENSDSYLAMGHVRFLQRRSEEMDSYIRRAIHFKKSIDTYKISAHMYFYNRLDKNAARIYNYLLFTLPEHLTTMEKLAVIAARNGDAQGAVHFAEMILETHPRRNDPSDERNIRIAISILETAGGGIK